MKTILCFIIFLMLSCSYLSGISRVPAQDDREYSSFDKAKDLFM